ncbi:hypothetical protein [Dactylosporangium sp. NPDC050588]|uniref:hypothetical protein n=1 Tax=Dactylosporangium sp. NPDC050588 TaxID=3157211 RepID=UPI0033D51265
MQIESVEQDLTVVDHNEKLPSSVSNPQTTNVRMVPCRRRHAFGPVCSGPQCRKFYFGIGLRSSGMAQP